MSLDFQATERKANQLIGGEQLGAKRGDKSLFGQFDITLSSGSRLGLIGGNGCGKSTLLHILGGVDKDFSGQLKHANELRIATFAQARANLERDVTVRSVLAPGGGETVNVHGRDQHVFAWAARFLFTPEKLRETVANLSGGEQARLLLARLMLEPADVLLLDEPTNDLDIPASKY